MSLEASSEDASARSTAWLSLTWDPCKSAWSPLLPNGSNRHRLVKESLSVLSTLNDNCYCDRRHRQAVTPPSPMPLSIGGGRGCLGVGKSCLELAGAGWWWRWLFGGGWGCLAVAGAALWWRGLLGGGGGCMLGGGGDSLVVAGTTFGGGGVRMSGRVV